MNLVNTKFVQIHNRFIGYKDTNVLRNKINIRNNEMLKNIEADIFAVKQTELLINPINGRYSINHLCNIHRFLFGDIYSFAGHLRKEDILKGETRFLNYSDIRKKLTSLLKELHSENCLKNLEYIFPYMMLNH